jgi:hypothetical protein
MFKRFSGIAFALSFVAFLGTKSSMAQNWQAGFQLGGTNYFGELQEKNFDLSQARFMFGLAGAYHLNGRLSLMGSIFKGNITGADNASNSIAAQQRNLSFATRLYEVSLAGRFNLLDFEKHAIVPYVFGGIAIFRINPYAFAQDGAKLYLIPLSTEGQSLPNYPERQRASLYNFALPFGGGLSARLNEFWSLDLELGYRKTFMDYMDDVSTYYADPALLLNAFGPRSVEMAYRGGELPNGNPNYPGTGAQRGTPASNDWYYAGLIRLNYTFGGRKTSARSSGPSYNKKQYACPSVF